MLSLEDAYAAVVRGEQVVVAHPPAPRLIRLTGPQRVWFLQNTITTDVDAIEPGTWAESFLLDERGRIFAHFLLGVTDEEIVIADEPAYGPRLAEWFLSRRFRTKVEIELLDDALQTRFGSSAPDATFTPPASFARRFGDVSLSEVFESDGGPGDAPMELLEVIRIEAGVARFGVDYDERTLPQEAGLTRAVSVDKGCYVGQETVARIHFRGHINKVLRTLRFESEVASGSELVLDGDVVGRVTSSVVSPRFGPVGIGMVRVEPAQGAELFAGDVRAVLGPIPEGTKVRAS